MKKLFYLSVVLFFTIFCFPQDMYSTPTFTIPQFPGGEKALEQYINQHLVYPSSIDEDKKQGIIIIQFAVAKDGKLEEAKILGSFDDRCNDAALNLIASMPDWIPAKEGNTPIDCFYTLPVKISNLKLTREKVERDRINELQTKTYDSMAEFVGGDSAMHKFIHANMRYPMFALDNKLQGNVYHRFIVTSEGKIENASILKGFYAECDTEALRIIRLMPNWIPAKKNGKPEDSLYTLRVTFRLPK